MQLEQIYKTLIWHLTYSFMEISIFSVMWLLPCFCQSIGISILTVFELFKL
jgi:hypothetical protein